MRIIEKKKNDIYRKQILSRRKITWEMKRKNGKNGIVLFLPADSR